MDALETSVIRVYEQTKSVTQTSKQCKISWQKANKILINAGIIQTPESKLYNQKHTVNEICQMTGKSRKVVLSRIPYGKCMYDAEYPSPNALKIRKSREKNNENNE